MKTIPSDKSSRCWTVAGLPRPTEHDKPELEIVVNYTGDSTCDNAIPLDTYVVPLLKLAPKLLDAVSLQRPLHSDFFTDEERELILKLVGGVACPTAPELADPRVFATIADILGRRGRSELILDDTDRQAVQRKSPDAATALFIRQLRHRTPPGCLVTLKPQYPL